MMKKRPPHSVITGSSFGHTPSNSSKFSEPLMDVLDAEGFFTGTRLSKTEIHQQGLWHRAVHLYLVDTAGHILLQKRSQRVEHYSGMWTISLTGHVDAGEGSTEALFRELREELGLGPAQVRVEHLLSYRKEATLGPLYIDRQINEVFLGFLNQEKPSIPYPRDEVSDVRFVSFAEFRTMIDNPKTNLEALYGRACSDVMRYLENTLCVMKRADSGMEAF